MHFIVERRNPLVRDIFRPLCLLQIGPKGFHYSHHSFCCAFGFIDFEVAPLASYLTCAVLAHYATCLADTLASELGILASKPPVLITAPWKCVPPGTNGGVTVEGFLWGGVGGLLMGTCQMTSDLVGSLPMNSLATLAFAVTCGVLGNTIDSLLGATLQVSYFDPDKKLAYSGPRDTALPKGVTHTCGVDILTNAQVNLLSVAITMAIGSFVLGPYFFQ